MGNTFREKSGGKGRVWKLERKRRALPAEQECWSMVVKKSTARAAQGLQEKSFMPGVQLPPEHRSAVLGSSASAKSSTNSDGWCAGQRVEQRSFLLPGHLELPHHNRVKKEKGSEQNSPSRRWVWALRQQGEGP